MRIKLIVLVMILILSAGCAGSDESGEAGAKGNIDAGLLQAYAGHLAESDDHPEDISPEYVLEHVQNMEALIAEGKKQGLLEIDEFKQAVHQFKSRLIMQTLQPELVPEISRDSITDEETRKYFEEHEQAYRLPDLYRVNMAYASDEQEIRDLLSRMQDQAADMRELTREMEGVEFQELDPGPLNRIPEEYRDVLQDMEPGEVSRIMSPEDEHLVLILEEVDRDRVQNFEERKEYIRNDALYSQYRQAWQEAYTRLREKHQVFVHEEEAERFRENFNPHGRE